MSNGISKVVVGDVAKSLDHINLGKKTNQNFVNFFLGQFIDKLGYKLGSDGIKLVVTDEIIPASLRFVDDYKMPLLYNLDVKLKPVLSGKRVKRGMYKSSEGIFLNAHVNGAYNILRKTDANFSLTQLICVVGKSIYQWLHPTKRVRFLNQKTHKPSNPKHERGDNGL
jgi:putative transposase